MGTGNGSWVIPPGKDENPPNPPPGHHANGACLRVTRLNTPIGSMVAGATDAGLWFLTFVDDLPDVDGPSHDDSPSGDDPASPTSSHGDSLLSSLPQIPRFRQRFGLPIAPGPHPHLERLQDELARYFAGALRRFSVPVVLHGTAFQQAVWRQLCRIPYGETRSYQELAQAVHRPRAVRAVGQANARNPIAIVVPCHRILRKDGDLGGYAAQPWRKRYLLDLEKRVRSVHRH